MDAAPDGHVCSMSVAVEPPTEARPGPGARVVGRPRVAAVLFLGLLVAIGVYAVVVGVTRSDVGTLIIGLVFFVVPEALALVVSFRQRVWVDGDVLLARRFRGWAPPLRLDRLRIAWLSPFGRNSGRQLHLV